jgi:aspartate aminotransferase
MALLEPGDEVLVPSPYWVTYPEQIRLAGAEPVIVPTTADEGFKLDLERLAAATGKRTRAIVLNYPSNPTGACYSREELESIAELAVRHELAVIADEIYSRLLYDGRRFVSIAELGDEIRERTVMINGMSKTWSMTGWRVGWAAGPREVVRGMSRLQSHATSNVTTISQWASLAGLQMEDDEIERRVAEFQRRRDRIVERLQALPGVSCNLPVGAFYVFPDVSGCLEQAGLAGGEALAELLLERANVAVVPGEAFGSATHVRFSYATAMEQIEEGMDRVAALLATA